MEWVETTAKTVDAAKDLALDRLGVDEHDAEFEVLEEPRPGLFGRMRGEARVRARVRPVQPRPKADRRDRRRSRGGKGRGRRPEDAPAESPGSSPDDDGVDDDGVDEDAGEDVAVAAGSTGASRSGSSKRRGRSRSKGEAQQSPAADGAGGDRDDEESTMSEDVTVEEQATMVEEFLTGLVEAFGYQAEVGTTRVDDETIEVHADGDELGLLVGPKGATLQAIHDLSRTVVQRRASGHHEGRVRIDVSGYREKRRTALERFTHKLADAVLASGTPQVLEPMGPADRKVVHDTVNEIDGVRTTSEGEEPRRRVVILPDGD